MSQIVLPDALLAQLKAETTPVECTDSTGHFVGLFLPSTPEQRLKFLYAWAKAQFPESKPGEAYEEYKRVGGYTTAEALAYLNRLEDDIRGRS